MSGVIWQRIRARLLVTSLLVASAALAGLIVGQQAGADTRDLTTQAASFSNVKTGQADAVDATDVQCVTADADPEPEFVDMPGMTETFSFGGTASRPVIVMFQAMWGVIFGAFMRIKIDDVIQPDPTDDPNGIPVGRGVLGGFNFISQRLAPGTHTATMQYAAYGPEGERACVTERSLIILHK